MMLLPNFIAFACTVKLLLDMAVLVFYCGLVKSLELNFWNIQD
jgi:hypothetical protein